MLLIPKFLIRNSEFILTFNPKSKIRNPKSRDPEPLNPEPRLLEVKYEQNKNNGKWHSG